MLALTYNWASKMLALTYNWESKMLALTYNWASKMLALTYNWASNVVIKNAQILNIIIFNLRETEVVVCIILVYESK
jgi:hypothetical protein